MIGNTMDKKVIRNDLKKLKQLFTKYKWIKGLYAAKANGRTWCYEESPEAKCFCISGGLMRIEAAGDTHDYLDAYCSSQFGTTIIGYNDKPTTKKKDIMNLIDNCITSLK